MPVDIADIRTIVDAQDQWRSRQTINLIASENAQSQAVRAVTVNGALAQDFIHGDRINNADISLYLNGGGGDDYLYGGAGGDTLDGGDDEDTLEGSGGDDWLEEIGRASCRERVL